MYDPAGFGTLARCPGRFASCTWAKQKVCHGLASNLRSLTSSSPRPSRAHQPEASAASMSSTTSKKASSGPAIDIDSVKRGIEWLDKMMAGLWQKNEETNKAIVEAGEELGVVNRDIAMNAAKLEEVKKNVRANRAKLDAVNAQISEQTMDMQSLLAQSQALLKQASKKSRSHASRAASDYLEIQRGYSAKIDTKTLIKTGPMGTRRATTAAGEGEGVSTFGGVSTRGPGAFGATQGRVSNASSRASSRAGKSAPGKTQQ